jgi:hypothetical protein
LTQYYLLPNSPFDIHHSCKDFHSMGGKRFRRGGKGKGDEKRCLGALSWAFPLLVNLLSLIFEENVKMKISSGARRRRRIAEAQVEAPGLLISAMRSKLHRLCFLLTVILLSSVPTDLRHFIELKVSCRMMPTGIDSWQLCDPHYPLVLG